MRNFALQREAFVSKQKSEPNALSQMEAGASGDRSLYEEMSIMSELSALIYTVAYLLDKIGEGGYPIESDQSWWSSWWSSTKPKLKQLNKTKLVLDEAGDNADKVTLLKNLPAINVLDFVDANDEALSQDEKITGDVEEGDVHPKTELLLTALKNIKANQSNNYLWSFDHHFGGTGIVYAVTVNRAFKRITVAFRGSVTDEDWWQNAQVAMATLPTPTALHDEFGFTEEIKVHGGFMRYLLDDDKLGVKLTSQDMREKKTGKYGQILLDLEDCFNHEEDGVKVHQGFQLYVCGHSLGGALSSLLAMKLAASDFVKKNMNVKMPVINVSVASPYVGNQAFQDATKVLEDNELLRHIRITNEHDVVPVLPPKRLLYGAVYEPYVHTGINVHLIAGKGVHDIGYLKERTFASQTSLWSGTRHAIVDYWGRQKEDEDDFQKLSISNLYEKYAS